MQLFIHAGINVNSCWEKGHEPSTTGLNWKSNPNTVYTMKPIHLGMGNAMNDDNYNCIILQYL